jgi:hypothetical protein
MFLAFAGTAWAGDWDDCIRRDLDYERAICGCTDIIAAGRDSPDFPAGAYLDRGVAYMHEGDYYRAIADETKAK